MHEFLSAVTSCLEHTPRRAKLHQIQRGLYWLSCARVARVGSEGPLQCTRSFRAADFRSRSVIAFAIRIHAEQPATSP
jgi:hypothetical protein